jgi:amidohydrolase
MPDRPAGEIRFLFQPSEEDQDAENKSGGFRMVEEGAMEGVDAVIALHVSSSLEANKIEVAQGYMMAAVDKFIATIYGKGCHGAGHHLGIDPIYLLGQVINAVYGVRARRIDPTKPAVVSICSVHGGTADNIIPNEVNILGTLRSYDPEIREQLRTQVEEAFGVARVLGGDYKFELVPAYPATYNDPEVAQLIHSTAAELFGSADVAVGEPIMGAEDFSYMAQAAPGAMFWLGAKMDEVDRPHHSPQFNIDESCMQRGAAVLAETACRLLAQHSR